MTCPAENTLLGYVGGSLDEDASAAVEHHLDGCSTCRFLFADLVRGDDAGSAGARRTVSGPAADSDSAGPPSASTSIPSLDLSDPLQLPTGTVVGRYVIVGLVGRGGMGMVYKAFDPELDRTVALKLVGLAGLGRQADEARLRLVREARTLARLSHPNVVAVHDVGTFEGDVFLAMEFVPGKTLRAWRREHEPGPREVLAVFRAAGAGLAAAHRVGIVHRDFKPDNVMVGDDGRVRVLDFGLARSAVEPTAERPIDDAAAATAGDLSPLTRAGMVVGTPGYMAPEQDRGGEVDARSDQFAFAAALYEGLYGRLPFEGESYRELAAHRREGRIVQPPSVRGIGPRVRRAILRGLRVDPADRHPDMDVLLIELGRRPWATRARIAAALLVVAAAASGAWTLWARTSASPSIAETCAEAGADVKRVWNPGRRDALSRSFAASGHPESASITARVIAGLDAWTGEWAAKRVELCEMPMRRVSVTDRFVADRLQCLERRIGVVDAVIEAYTEAATRTLVEDARIGVDRLERPATCDALVVGNATTEQKEKWRPAVRGLVQARLDLAAGKPDGTIKAARVVADAARASRDTEPLCAALALIGQAHGMRGELVEAREVLRDAIRACTEVKEESLAADSWVELVSMFLRTTRFDADLESTIFGAELAMMRLPSDDMRPAALAYRIGTVRFMRGDPAEAIRQLRRAESMFRAAGADRHQGDLGAVANSLGLMLINRGEWAAAEKELGAALAAWKAAGPNGALNHAVTTGNLGAMRMLQRRFSDAEPLLRNQVAELEALAPSLGAAGQSSLADAWLDLGLFFAVTDRCPEADPLLADGLKAVLAAGPDVALLEAVARLGQGVCQLDRGETRAAVTSLERALEVAEREPLGVFQRPRIRFALARARWAAGDRRRALALADEARSGYAAIAGAAVEKTEVEAWLAARRPRDRAER